MTRSPSLRLRRATHPVNLALGRLDCMLNPNEYGDTSGQQGVGRMVGDAQ